MVLCMFRPVSAELQNRRILKRACQPRGFCTCICSCVSFLAGQLQPPLLFPDWQSSAHFLGAAPSPAVARTPCIESQLAFLEGEAFAALDGKLILMHHGKPRPFLCPSSFRRKSGSETPFTHQVSAIAALYCPQGFRVLCLAMAQLSCLCTNA